MAEEKTLGEKAVRFIIVGLGNTVVDFAVFAVAIQFGLTSLLANVIAWLVAVSVSYIVNASWSFDRARSHRDALPRFLASGAIISLLVSSAAVGLLSGIIGLWPAKIGGTVLAAILNFFAARWSIENRIGR